MKFMYCIYYLIGQDTSCEPTTSCLLYSTHGTKASVKERDSVLQFRTHATKLMLLCLHPIYPPCKGACWNSYSAATTRDRTLGFFTACVLPCSLLGPPPLTCSCASRLGCPPSLDPPPLSEAPTLLSVFSSLAVSLPCTRQMMVVHYKRCCDS